MVTKKRKLYIAGPMRGYPEFNFPAFHKAEELMSGSWEVFNPARRDEEVLGIDTSEMSGEEAELMWTPQDVRDIAKADCLAVLEADAIYMLKGWEKSIGARAEHALASWIGLDILYQ